MGPDFRRIAIVNRGEPAMRAMHAIRELRHEGGEPLVAIALYTETDRGALFVREADEAYALGATTFVDPRDGERKSTYLDLDGLARALRATRAEAVWVGWGFVAEYAEFADLCAELGIVFIGPPGDVMRRLGDKISSKILAEESGVPVAPWSGRALADLDDALAHAERLGYPLMLKATAGGGGRGIRKVRSDDDLRDAFDGARSEALKFFGNGDLFLESLVDLAHHVEVQVVADGEGGVWALGVRDCTLQRRNQKIVEETPSPVLSAEQDSELRAAAARLAARAGYRNAGTVEFLYSPEAQSFAFMEVNARLQVEHPVTELVTDVDLVKLQIDIARGGRLPGEVPPSRGHAIEVRLNAEDPDQGFSPAPGRIEHFRIPQGPGLRIDTGVAEGDEISPEFDSMIAKIIARGRDRNEALARLRRGLAETAIVVRGGTTNKAFLQVLLERPEVVESTIDVGWLDRLNAEGVQLASRHAEIALLAAAIEVYEAQIGRARASFLGSAARGRPEIENGRGRSAELAYRSGVYTLAVRRLEPSRFEIGIDGCRLEIGVEALGPFTRRLTLGEGSHRVFSVIQGPHHLLEVDGIPHRVSEDEGGVVRAASPAVVVSIHVQEGDEVAVGDRLAVVEAMKMETAILAEAPGRVRKVLVRGNVQVAAGAALFEIEPNEDGAESRAPAVDLLPQIRELAEAVDSAACPVRDLKRLMLGYDLDPARIRAALAGPAPDMDATERLRQEDEILGIFADICALGRRQPTRDEIAEGQRRGREEFLFTYLRDLGAEGEGLPESFLDSLRRALCHYGVDGLERSPELEEAIFRIYKSHREMDGRVVAILGVLERRLELTGSLEMATAKPAADSVFRELLERMIAEAQGRYPGVRDLAREVIFRVYDAPFLEIEGRRVQAEMKKHLAALEALLDIGEAKAGAMRDGTRAARHAEERAEHMDALVDCPQLLKDFLSQRFQSASPAFRPVLLEILTRRFYRLRQLRDVTSATADGGLVHTRARFEHYGESYALLTVHAEQSELGGVSAELEALLATLPDGHRKVLDVYLWRDAEVFEPTAAGLDAASDALLEVLRPVLERQSVERVVAAISSPASGAHGTELQPIERFTFRPGENGWAEDRALRHLHPTTNERLEIDRVLRHFETERLMSASDVYLFRAVARENPQDERLIAFTEVRDLTPLRSADGTIVELPELERVFMEAIAGLRRVQARRPVGRRLEWNRIFLDVWPPADLAPSELRQLVRRLSPEASGLGLEKIKIRARLATGRRPVREVVFDILNPGNRGAIVAHRGAVFRPLLPLDEHTRKVVRLRQRGLMHPYELIRLLTADGRGAEADLPPGDFTEHDLDAEGRLVPVVRPAGGNQANIVVGLVRTYTERYPEGMTRVILLGDPSRGMGALAEPECRRILAGLDLAEALGVPLEWFAISAGAKISMDSGTENLDWVAKVLRRLVRFTQDGGEVNVVVGGINVGAQPYWNAESTMLMHTRGVLIMTDEGAMVLTGKQALDFSGGVSAEDNRGIGGYERVMGSNGQAQYFARDMAEACQILLRYYEHAYVAPGETFPRPTASDDPPERDIRDFPHDGGAVQVGFERVGDVFSGATNPGRKKPFDIRRVLRAVTDQDHDPLERWSDMRDAENAVVWDVRLGGHAVCLLGIESNPLPRLGPLPADGPDQWTAGTLFPLSSKKVARAINASSGSRPLVILANLSGFDGSPESLRKLQLEYGAEIGRALVNFEGPVIFCVISRYHGGAFVVFSQALHDNMEVAAIEGSYASVIGGAPAAAVVFARQVEARVRTDSRLRELEERIANAEGTDKAKLLGQRVALRAEVRSEKLGEMAEEFDAEHSIARAQRVGSVHRILPPGELRPYLIDAVERGMQREIERLRSTTRRLRLAG